MNGNGPQRQLRSRVGVNVQPSGNGNGNGHGHGNGNVVANPSAHKRNPAARRPVLGSVLNTSSSSSSNKSDKSTVNTQRNGNANGRMQNNVKDKKIKRKDGKSKGKKVVEEFQVDHQRAALAATKLRELLSDPVAISSANNAQPKQSEPPIANNGERIRPEPRYRQERPSELLSNETLVRIQASPSASASASSSQPALSAQSPPAQLPSPYDTPTSSGVDSDSIQKFLNQIPVSASPALSVVAMNRRKVLGSNIFGHGPRPPMKLSVIHSVSDSSVLSSASNDPLSIDVPSSEDTERVAREKSKLELKAALEEQMAEKKRRDSVNSEDRRRRGRDSLPSDVPRPSAAAVTALPTPQAAPSPSPAASISPPIGILSSRSPSSVVRSSVLTSDSRSPSASVLASSSSPQSSYSRFRFETGDEETKRQHVEKALEKEKNEKCFATTNGR